jgi:uncharacterized protein (UPF0333 family)
MTRAPVGRRERGQATIEFVLVLPLVIVALLAILQLTIIVRDQVLLVEAAREAARAASVAADPSAAATRVLPGATVMVGGHGGVGSPITVQVSYRVETVVPIIGAWIPDPVLHESAVMRSEQ